MRMSEVPEIHTRILATNNPPSGMGEIGVVTVAPAIANAVFQLTGKRLRHLPMTADRVKKDAGVSKVNRSPAAIRPGCGGLLIARRLEPFKDSRGHVYLLWLWRTPRMDDKTRTELEAAVFRRLVEHLRLAH